MKSSLESFIHYVEQDARESERRRVVDKLEEYFKGLVVIPDPQSTKESLIDFLSPTLKDNK